MSQRNTLVSVGIPVYQGGAAIRLAVESILNQSYEDLEILISDNCSTDDTEEICRELAARDSRIRYDRQHVPLTAHANFRHVLDRSHGTHFMWAAHDDLRTPNYIEVLRRGFDEFPSASIVFSDSVAFNDYSNLSSGSVTDYRCDTRGLSFRERHQAQGRSNCCHVYGLINASYLRLFPWIEIDVGPDHLLLHWLLCYGDFIYTPGAIFYYYQPVIAKTREQTAAELAYRRLKAFPLVRFAWACAGLVGSESARTGASSSRISLALFFYSLVYGGPKHWLYENAPETFRQMWRWGKRQVASLGDINLAE